MVDLNGSFKVYCLLKLNTFLDTYFYFIVYKILGGDRYKYDIKINDVQQYLKAFLKINTAVSYTHLDVYKRQV